MRGRARNAAGIFDDVLNFSMPILKMGEMPKMPYCQLISFVTYKKKAIAV
jgi:hypothetical protein